MLLLTGPWIRRNDRMKLMKAYRLYSYLFFCWVLIFASSSFSWTVSADGGNGKKTSKKLPCQSFERIGKCFRKISSKYEKQNHRIKNAVNYVISSEILTLALTKLYNIPSARRWSSTVNFEWLQELQKLDPGGKAAACLIGVNGIVLFSWYIGILLGGYNKWHRWMMLNFLEPTNVQLRQKLPHTIITASFSHVDANHFLSNMAALWMFVPNVFNSFKSTRLFSYFYVGSAYASTFLDYVLFSRIPRSWLSEDSFLVIVLNVLYDEIMREEGSLERRNKQDKKISFQPKQKPEYSLGASGIISSMITFSCLTYRDHTFKMKSDGTSLQAPLAALAWAINDFAFLHDADGVGHGAHLGGSLFGAIFYFFHKHAQLPTYFLKMKSQLTGRFSFRKHHNHK